MSFSKKESCFSCSINGELKPLSHRSSVLTAIPRHPRKMQNAEVRAVRSQASPQQRSDIASRAQCMHCERRESAENHQQELCSMNAIELHASSIVTPCRCKDAVTGPFTRKLSGFSCDLTALQKIKQLRANTMETQLGVTGL